MASTGLVTSLYPQQSSGWFILQVKQAYKKLALRWHPDVLPANEREKAEAVFKDIVAAYSRISTGVIHPKSLLVQHLACVVGWLQLVRLSYSNTS